MDNTLAQKNVRAQAWTAWGLALAALSVMTLEIELTRIFSVTMWYHFAFLAISVAMFGTSLGAVVVYIFDRWFPQNRIHQRLTLITLLYAVSIPVSLKAHLSIPFMPVGTFLGVLSVTVTYLILLVPFTLAGIVVSLSLTRFPKQAGSLYAADLTGAAIGCLAVFVLMNIFDGPTAVIAVSLLALAGAWCFGRAQDQDASTGTHHKTFMYVAAILLVAAVAGNAIFGFARVQWAKNEFGLPVPVAEKGLLLERWNPMSRIIVNEGTEIATGWGLSPNWTLDNPGVKNNVILIDNAAGTAIFDGRKGLKSIEFLKDDVTALAYNILPPKGKAAIIGVGGGKDINTALMYGAGDVLGIEINNIMLQVLNEDFGEFAGHLDRRPEVRFTVDEARSYLARTDERFDVIQASLIDSWAATAAGAFVLTENGLYTVEGWKLFISRLTDKGMVTFSRWYLPEQPGEMLRLLSVAVEAMRQMGIKNPAQHIYVAAKTPVEIPGVPKLSVATLIATKKPLTQGNTKTLDEACERLQFERILTPVYASRPDFLGMLRPDDAKEIFARYPLDLTPSTDDRPFFFNMVSPFKAFDPGLKHQVITQFNIDSVRMIIYLLGVLIVLSLLTIVVPLWIKVRPGTGKPLPTFAGLLYFAGIGLGFMLVEMGQVHRLSVYMGHPTWGLIIVLMGIMLAAGLGSRVSEKLTFIVDSRRAALIAGAIFLAILALFVLITPPILQATEAVPMSMRILLGLLLVGIPGFFMGMPFPLGLRLASRLLDDRLPWLWGINGAFSVVGSVIALLVSIGAGLTVSMLTGVASYGLGALFLAMANNRD